MNRILRTVSVRGQARTFTYVHRGFLASERLPEVGPSGNGTASYTSYDARGHLLSKNDGLHTLSFAYDRAERMTTVTDAATGAQRTFTFDKNLQGQQQGYSLGKLVVASSYAPDITFPVQYQTHTGTTTVTESYTYAGVGGATSQKDTHVTVSGSSNGAFDLDKTFTQTFAWTDLGKLDHQTYPSLPGVAPDRTVYDGYANGYLTAVLPQHASSITYHPNGMMQSVVHANYVTDSQAPDPNAMARPQQISTSGAKVNGAPGGDWSTNPYGYDGSGNVKAMGGDTFVYDPVSRLTSATIARYSGAAEAYAYDAYGNLTGYGGRALTTDPGTNRLNGFGMNPHYDNAGNLTNWTDVGSGVAYTFTYTPMNQLLSVSGGGLNRRLAYTADGERIVVRDGPTTMLTLRGLDGRVLSEITFDGTNWSWSKDYVYRAGALLSSVSAAAGLHHYAVDHLGSPRLVTNRCGEQIRLFATNAFGLDPQGTLQDSERMRFTVHERDLGDPSKTLDDMDTMHARSYMPFLGRFTSADLLRGDPHSPQSFNLFAYVQGNPTGSLDPLGLGDWRPSTLHQIDEITVTDTYVLVNPMPFDVYWAWQLNPLNGLIFFTFPGGTSATQTSQQPKTPCPAVPPTPAGASLRSNIAEAKSSRWFIFAAPRLFWFYLQVRNRGPWDYKQITTMNDFQEPDQPSPYVDFGNFNYGVTGAAAGIPLPLLLRAAGWAQGQAGTSDPAWGNWYGSAPYGDAPADQAQIRAGFAYYEGGCH